MVQVMRYMNEAGCVFWRTIYGQGLILPPGAAETAISSGWAMIDFSLQIMTKSLFEVIGLLTPIFPPCLEGNLFSIVSNKGSLCMSQQPHGEPWLLFVQNETQATYGRAHPVSRFILKPFWKTHSNTWGQFNRLLTRGFPIYVSLCKVDYPA